MTCSSEADLSKKSVLIVGAYGLIGSGVAHRLMSDGHKVVGLGRKIETGKRVLPGINWLAGDLRFLTEARAWHQYLNGIDCVVNCSGALQEGPEDDLEIVHHHAVAALAKACRELDLKLVQISAVGATVEAETPFLASKARGDVAVQNSGARHNIFRPGLVLAQQSYGGTTMLRMLAAIPIVQPIAMPDAEIQTVWLDDLAHIVSGSIVDNVPEGFVGDVVEKEAHTLRDLVAGLRRWLGFRPARYELELSGVALTGVATWADLLSRLGWKSPLQSTAIKVLSNGVRAAPTDLTRYGVSPMSSFQQTLSNIPVGTQDRLFARMAVLTPIIVCCLSLFWLASGLVGLAQAKEAAGVLKAAGWSTNLAIASVVFWAFVDIAIGTAFGIRKFASAACWAAVGVGLFYLLASTVFVPSLWIDPLGPLVKVVPTIVLALVARAALDAR